MAIALVGSLGAVSNGGSMTPAYGQPSTAGNLLVLWITDSSGGTVTVTGTGWTRAGGATNDSAQVYYLPNCSAGQASPTITGGINGFSMLGEFSGVAGVSPFENDGISGIVVVSPAVATAGGIDAVSGNLVICPFCISLSKAATQTSQIVLTGGAATTLGNINNDSVSTAEHYRFSYGVTTTNSSADVATSSSDTMNMNFLDAKIASFKAGPNAPPVTYLSDTPMPPAGRGATW